MNKMCDDCQKLQNYKQALEEIKHKAEYLYYRAIIDPVKREKEVWSIREKCNEVLNDK